MDGSIRCWHNRRSNQPKINAQPGALITQYESAPINPPVPEKVDHFAPQHPLSGLQPGQTTIGCHPDSVRLPWRRHDIEFIDGNDTPMLTRSV